MNPRAYGVYALGFRGAWPKTRPPSDIGRGRWEGGKCRRAAGLKPEFGV